MVSATEHRESSLTRPQAHRVCTKNKRLHHLITKSRQPRPNAFQPHVNDRANAPPVSWTPLSSTYPLVWMLPAGTPFLLSIQQFAYFFLEVAFQTFSTPHSGGPSSVRSAANIDTAVGRSILVSFQPVKSTLRSTFGVDGEKIFIFPRNNHPQSADQKKSSNMGGACECCMSHFYDQQRHS